MPTPRTQGVPLALSGIGTAACTDEDRDDHAPRLGGAVAPLLTGTPEALEAPLLEPHRGSAVRLAERDLDLGRLALIEEQVPAVAEPCWWLPVEDLAPSMGTAVGGVLSWPLDRGSTGVSCGFGCSSAGSTI